jgi:hypothetical protein
MQAPGAAAAPGKIANVGLVRSSRRACQAAAAAAVAVTNIVRQQLKVVAGEGQEGKAKTQSEIYLGR